MLIRKLFGISMQALIHRFHDLEIITDSYYAQWWPLFTRLGWRKSEPGPLPFEEPQWLRRTLLRFLAEGLISIEDAERMLGEEIAVESPISKVQRRAFKKLPLEERRTILNEQAARMADHYAEDKEWRELETDDVIDY